MSHPHPSSLPSPARAPFAPRPAAVLACGAALLVGCAGFKGGWESVPYIGERPPAIPDATSPYESRQRSRVNAGGLTLGVAIHNQLRTYDTQVYLFALPLAVDARDAYTRSVQPGRTRVSIDISGAVAGYTFHPRLARLSVGGRTVQADAGFEFAMWDAQGRQVDSGGKWDHRPLGESLALTPSRRSHLLNLEFPIDTPSPESRDIVLDLSAALVNPSAPPLPPIRFVPARWKEGYT